MPNVCEESTQQESQEKLSCPLLYGIQQQLERIEKKIDEVLRNQRLDQEVD